MITPDVVIVGGGIGGGALAKCLGEAGVAVLVLERTLEYADVVRGEWVAPWGVPETNLHGIELSSDRVARALQVLPRADLRLGDAVSLPWESDTFKLVIASTVFTSILNDAVRQLVAKEIVRVLAPRGALLWYDFAVNNPRNSQVRGVGRRELRELFPELRGAIKSVTLAPPALLT